MKRAVAALFFVVGGACECDEPLRAIETPTRGAPAGPPPTFPPPGDKARSDAGPAPVVVDAGASPVDDRADAGDAPPPAPAPTTDGGVPVYEGPCGPVEVAPGYAAELWGEFQSTPGTGYQETVTLTFPCPAAAVTVTIYDPDYPDNELVAYDGANVLGRLLFVGDGAPGSLTTDTRTFTTPGAPITHVELHPDPLDFVSYGDISYTVP